MTAPKKILFVCHSYWDREAVDIFLDSVFGMKRAGKRREHLSKSWRIRYTSATSNLEEEPLEPGTNIWPRVRREIARTGFFIACLSESFFLNSFFCAPELTLYEERRVKRKGLPLLPLLVSPLAVSQEKSPLMKGLNYRALDLKDDLKKVFSYLRSKGVLAKSPNESERIEELLKDANSYYSKMEARAKGDFVDLAFRHFRGATPGGPVTYIVDRSEYEQVSITLAEQAKSKLLWTLFKSPLLVADAYLQKTSLMPYDESFRDFEKRKKLRLVIFLDPSMAKAYDKVDVSYHNRRLKRLADKAGTPFRSLTRVQLKTRKSAFEESSQKNGRLYFTTLNKLPQCLLSKPTPTFGKDSYLEFVYADCGEHGRDCILMEAGFNSEFALKNRLPRNRKHDTLCRHLTFYKMPTPWCSEAIAEAKTYSALYGHLQGLTLIGEALFAKTSPNPTVFCKPNQIKELYDP